MKKFGKMFLAVILAIFSSITVVNAASKCSYEEQAELNNAVANIKVSYEEAEGFYEYESDDLDESGGPEDAVYYYLKVHVYNIPENTYIKVTNDVNNEVKYLQYKDSESGVVSFDWNDVEKVANFIFTVYSNNKTGCPNEEYRIINLTLPRFNRYSKLTVCDDKEDFYLCQRYVSSNEEISDSSFNEEYTTYINKKITEEEIKKEENKTLTDKVKGFIGDNKITILVISTAIVVAGVVTTVIVIKKRRSRLI